MAPVFEFDPDFKMAAPLPFGSTANVFQFVLVSLLVLSLNVYPADTIMCYKCDALDQPSDCPGFHRKPLDTFMDLNDKGGLYTHCVEIRLGNGTILHQGPYPEKPLCQHDFKLIWKQTLANRYKQRVYVRCCDYNMCNGPSGGRAGGDRFPSYSLVALVLGLHLTFYSVDGRDRWKVL